MDYPTPEAVDIVVHFNNHTSVSVKIVPDNKLSMGEIIRKIKDEAKRQTEMRFA